jgi:ADP-ribose pyrophosphatase YjhB (NUDIX family)
MGKDKKVPKFVPQKDQVDYSNARWVPVVNSVVTCNEKIVLVERNAKMNFYPGYWNGISDFLDDTRSLEEKVIDEITEELGVEEVQIQSIQLCDIFDQEEPGYGKTWIVHAVLVKITTEKITLDWEAKKYEWVEQSEIFNYKLLPGFNRVLKATLSHLNEGE